MWSNRPLRPNRYILSQTAQNNTRLNDDNLVDSTPALLFGPPMYDSDSEESSTQYYYGQSESTLPSDARSRTPSPKRPSTVEVLCKALDRIISIDSPKISVPDPIRIPDPDSDELETIDTDGFIRVKSRKEKRERKRLENEVGFASPGTPEFEFLTSDTMKKEVDDVWFAGERAMEAQLEEMEQARIQETEDRRCKRLNDALARKKTKGWKKNNKKKREGRAARHRIVKSLSKTQQHSYQGHSSSTPTVLWMWDWTFYAFMMVMSYMFLSFYLEEPTAAVTVYSNFMETGNALVPWEGWYVIVLQDIQMTFFTGIGVYLAVRVAMQILLWIGSRINLYRNIRSMGRNKVFTSQAETQAKMEMVLKVLYITHWDKIDEAVVSLSIILQIFKPDMTIQNQCKKIFGRCIQSPTYVGESESIRKTASALMYHGQTDSEKEHQSKAEKYWNILSSSDLGMGLAQISVILVTAGVIPEIDWSVNNVEFFSLKAAKEVVHVSDVYSACRKIIVSVVDGVASYETTGRLDGFFANSSLESQVSYNLSLYQQVLIGNLYDYTNGMTNDAYITKLECLKGKVERQMRNPKSKDKFFLRPYLDKLNDTISAMASLNLTQKYQEQAFAVMFKGESSVGKSWSALPFIKWLLQINGYDHSDENVITYNTNSQFDDQIKNDTLGILLDDLANGKVGKGSTNQRRTSDLVISLINNVAQPAIKADVAEKGKVLMKMKIVLATTNNPELNASIESHKPGAVKRRFKYEVEFKVKKKYRIKDSHEIDADKVQEEFPGMQFPPVWEFYIERCQLVAEKKNQNGYIMVPVTSPSGKKFFEMKEYLEFMRDMSKKHFDVQKRNLSNNTKDVAIDEATQLPAEIVKYSGQTLTDDAYDFIFGEDEYVAPTPFETTLLRDTANILHNDPRVIDMMRASMSWKNWMVINALPSFFLRIWVFCGGSPSKFIACSLAILAWGPFFLAMAPLANAKIYATILFSIIVWVVMNMSVNCVFETIAANAASNGMRNVWRTVFLRSSRTTLLKRVALAGASFMFITWLLNVSEITYNGQSLEADTVEEEIEKIKTPSLWRKFTGIVGTSAKGRNCTMQTDELANRIQNNIVRVEVENGENIEKTCAFFLATGYLVVPLHFMHSLNNMRNKWIIHRTNGRKDEPVVDFGEVNGRRQWTQLTQDGVLIRMGGVNRATDIIDLFAERMNEGSYHSSRFLFRNKKGEMERHTVTSANPCTTMYDAAGGPYEAVGFRGHLSAPSQPGMCCSLAIADDKKPEIYGYHIAGNTEVKSAKGHTVIQSLTQQDIMSAITELDEVSGTKYIKQEFAYKGHQETCTTTEIHPLCASHHLNKNTPVEVIGSVPGSGPRHFKTKHTPYFERAQEYFGFSDPYVRPPSCATRVDGEIKSPFINCIKECNLIRNLIPFTLLAYAQDVIFDRIIGKLDLYIAAGGCVSPLTPEEAYRGTPDKGFEGHTWNTSSGLMWGGKKWCWLLNFDLPKTYKPEVIQTVMETIELAKKKIRIFNALNANLKDEPLKKKKADEFRTRVFFSDELHVMIAFTMYFGPPLAYLLVHPATACCAIGLNAMSYDWDCVWHYLRRSDEANPVDPRKHGIAFDFKAFDKTLPEMLMRFAWGILIRIAEKMPGYTEDDINVMHVLADEKVTPFIHFNGTLLQFFFLHTSGNGGTAAVGSLSGLLLLVCVFVHINDPKFEGKVNFFDHIRSKHLGDDCAATSRGDLLNFLQLQEVLASWGITITMPNKEDEPTEYQDLVKEDFLKRHFREDPLRDSIVGTLAKSSMYKSLCWYLPSPTEKMENQLGMSLSSTLLEASLYDAETYTHFQNFVHEIANEYKLHVPNKDLDYDDRIIIWASDSGKRHHDYRARAKPHVRKLAAEGKMSNAQQMNAFGFIVHPREEEEIKYFGQSETDSKDDEHTHTISNTKESVAVQIEEIELDIRCCTSSSCCTRRRRRDEEDDANIPGRISTSPRKKAKTKGTVENDGEPASPDVVGDTPSVRTARAMARARVHCCVITIVFLFLCGLSEAYSVPEFDQSIKGKGLTERKENITFKFNDQSWTNSVPTSTESSAKAATHSGMALGDFLSRPVKIGETTWTTNNQLTVTELDPWDAFLTNPAVARKIANYKMLRGNLHVKIVTNGSPFLYGKLMAYYNPLTARDAFLPENIESRLTRLSQRQKIFINPTTSSGGELVLPFFWQFNAVHIPSKEWTNLGDIRFLPISNLKHAAGEVPACNITIFAWMDGVELMQSTASWPGYTGQSESEKKVVSKTATVVGDVAHVLADAPMIGPYARATEEVARSVGWFADLFGFSKPRGTHDICDERQRHLGSLATTNDKDMARPLTLDVKNETTIDPRTVGLSGKDEMSIPTVCQNECILTRFSWNVTDVPDTELFRIPVTPFIKSTFPTDGLTDMPPCAYVASFFEYWRGTMKYRFIFNASNFHRGKLRFRYEPYGSTNELDYNVVQSEIIDLSETHDYAIEIGWGADRNNLQVMGNNGNLAIPNTSADLLKHNGTIIVSVANNLTVPDETSDSEIDVLVGVTAGEDIQFHVPTDRSISTINLFVDQSSISTPAPEPDGSFPQPVDIGKYTFGVYYYGWHTNNFNNDQGYIRQELTDPVGTAQAQFPQQLDSPNIDGEYVDTDTAVIRRQLDAMLKCGITHVCCSYWGSTSRTHTQLLQLRTLLGVGASGLGHMRMSLHYEAAKFRNSDGSWKDLFNGGADATEFYNDIVAMKDQLQNTDKAIWRKSHVSGEAEGPMIVIYLFRSMPYFYSKQFLQKIHDVFLDSNIEGYSAKPHIVVDGVFGNNIPTYDSTIRSLIGGITAYDVYGQTARTGNQTTEADVLEYHERFVTAGNNNARHKIIPTISPGYNDRGVRLSANHEPLDRALVGYEKGSLFKCHLKHLATSAAKFNGSEPRDVFINSWNEWHEDSQIEPCGGTQISSHPTDLTLGVEYEPYGAKYLNILGNYTVPSYVGQTESEPKVRYVGQSEAEAQNEHTPEMETSLTMVNKQNTYHHDDAVYFGERVGSLRSMIKRYTRLMTRPNPSVGIERMKLPQYPFYMENQPTVTNGVVAETLLNRIGCLFLGRRGSIRYKCLNDFHNSIARLATVELTPTAEFAVDGNQDHSVLFNKGWNGMDAVTGVYNPVLEWEVPYYSNARFHDSRSLSREQDRGHAHCYDTNACYRNHYLVAAGDDLQFFYFMGTPSVTFT